MNWITDKRVLIGAAVGFFVVPRLIKVVRPQIEKLRG